MNKPKQLFSAGKILLIILLLFSAKQASPQKLNEDSIKKVISEARQDSTRIDAMLTYANYLIKHKQHDSAGLKILLEAKELSEKKNYTPGLVQAMLNTGNYYRQTGNWQKSIETFHDLIKMAPQIQDTILQRQTLMKVYNNLGGIHNINGDFSGSLENRLQSAMYMESLPPNPNNAAVVYLNIASDYRQLKEYRKAKEYVNKIKNSFTSLNDRLKLEYYYEYYHILIGEDDTSSARKLLPVIDSAIAAFDLSDFQKLDYGLMSAKIHGVYEMDYTKNYSKALLYFNECADKAQKFQNNIEIVTATYNKGWAHYSLKNYPVAADELKKSYDLAIASDLKNAAYKAAKLLSECYEKLNTPVQGLAFSQAALKLQDSIFSMEKVEQLNFLEAKYQNEKREKEISNLQQANLEKEFVIKRKNLFLVGSIVLLILLGFLAIMALRYYRNKQQLLQKEKNLREEQIRSMEKQQQVISLQSMINGQESERIRIAKDLHDGLGGVFSTVKMHYSTLQHEMPEVKNNSLYRKTFELINNASDELRKVAHNMMPEVLMKVGLIEALRDFCNNISAGKLLSISLQTYGMEKRLSSSTEVMLFRIIQELVNNIIKHSYANEAIIQINREGNRLSIVIEDNGKGFDTREAEEKRTMGISTVKSRVDYLNGKLTIDSQKGIGTTVMINILLNEN